MEAAVWPRCAADVGGLITPAEWSEPGRSVRRIPCAFLLARRAGRGGSASDGGAEPAPAGETGPAGPLHGRGSRPPTPCEGRSSTTQLSGSYVVSVGQWSLRQHSPLGHGDHASVQTNQPPKLESACGEPPLWGPLCGLAGCSQSKGPRVSPEPLRRCSAVGMSLGPPKSGSRDSRLPIPCSSFSSSILMFYPLLFTYIFGIYSSNQSVRVEL